MLGALLGAAGLLASNNAASYIWPHSVAHSSDVVLEVTATALACSAIGWAGAWLLYLAVRATEGWR